MLPTMEKFDKKLILLVKENPVLYDHNHAKYMDFNAREVAWQKIGDELKRPALDCKVRWINIRDVYRRIIRNVAKSKSRRKKHYKYEKEISFLKTYFRDIIPNEEEESPEELDYLDDDGDHHSNDESDTKFSEPKEPKVEKKWRKNRKSEINVEVPDDGIPTVFAETSMSAELDTTDPVDTFLLSIGATLKRFSPYHLNIAKSKIFSIVQEHDLQQIVQKEQSNDTPHDIKMASSNNIFMQ